jgi:hypothetical protein
MKVTIIPRKNIRGRKDILIRAEYLQVGDGSPVFDKIINVSTGKDITYKFQVIVEQTNG